MTEKNRDHVAVSTGSGVSWNFLLPSEATTCSAQAEELTALCGALFDAFEEFLTPLEITYEIRLYPEDRPLPFGDESAEPVKTITRTLRENSGITASEFESSTRVSGNEARFLSMIPFEHNLLQVRLDGETTIIDRTDCVQYENGTPSKRECYWDPLSIKVAHSPNRQCETIDTEYVSRIGVSIRSDLWIEETGVGAENRRLLTDFFDRIADRVPFETVKRDVYRTSDFWVDLGIPARAESFDPREIY